MASYSDDFLQKFFRPYPYDTTATKAKFWNLPDLSTNPTIHLSGDVELKLNGASNRFPEGAFVYQQADGKLNAMPSKAAFGGGITVDGQPVRAVTTSPTTNYRIGNMANLLYEEHNKMLHLNMPEGQNGAYFRYPAPSSQELVALAEKQNAVMLARSGGGKIVEGFFVEGKGGTMPSTISTFHDGLNLKGGEFVAINRTASGEIHNLFAYKPYTAKEIEQISGFGRYSPPGNDVTQLTTLEGKPLAIDASPRLNVETEKAKIPWSYRPAEIDTVALRQHHIDESVKEAQFKQRLAAEFPNTYGTRAPYDEAKIREAAGKSFDERAGTKIGQTQLLSELDEMARSNVKRAASYAEKDGLGKVVSELAGTKTLGLVERTPLTASELFAKTGLKLTTGIENAALLQIKPLPAPGSLIEGAVAASEKGLGKTLLGAGKTAGIIVLAAAGTAAAVAGVEYLMHSASKENSKADKTLLLPEFSLNHGLLEPQRGHLESHSDSYEKAMKTHFGSSESWSKAGTGSGSDAQQVERLLEKSSGNKIQNDADTKTAEEPRG